MRLSNTRPSQDDIVQHFQPLATATLVPLGVYNVSYRTDLTLTADTFTNSRTCRTSSGSNIRSAQ